MEAKRLVMNHRQIVDRGRMYLSDLVGAINDPVLEAIADATEMLRDAWRADRTVFICGNGGSASNALHIANDLHYGVGCTNDGKGVKVEALPANVAIVTCLANDTGYDNIYAKQLDLKGSTGDVLVALSGSGNSPNISKAVKHAKRKGMKTIGILGFDGGECKELVDLAIHVNICDMQIAEDSQLIVGHIWMKSLTLLGSEAVC